MTPELSRKFAVAKLGEGTRFTVQATPAELAAVAERMGLVAIEHLTCRFDLHPADRGAVLAAGHLAARVVQSCVVSLEPFSAVVEEDFLVRFVPEGTEADDLDLEAEDEIPYAGTHLDLGEAAAEQLALALDPFPRKPGVAMPQEAGDGDGGALGALARLLPPG